MPGVCNHPRYYLSPLPLAIPDCSVLRQIPHIFSPLPLAIPDCSVLRQIPHIFICALINILAIIAGTAAEQSSESRLCTTVVFRVRMSSPPSIMSETFRKRGCESEDLPESFDVREPKRFHGAETDRLLLLQLDKALADDDEEECAVSEDLLDGVMRSLEEEIAATGSTSYISSNLAVSDISSVHKGEALINSDLGIDLYYLLEASDDELGIPPSPLLDLKHDVCQFPKEKSEILWENWHFEDDFENYQQFALCEDAWDVKQLQDWIKRDFPSQDMFFDGTFSAAGTLEAASRVDGI